MPGSSGQQLDSYLGGVIGWRGAFFCLVPIAAVALVWQWVSLPALPAMGRNISKSEKVHTKKAADARNVFSLLRRPVVALGMAAMGLFFMGQFELFTYVRPFLESVTRVNSLGLSSILLIIGVAGFIGTLVVSAFLNRKFYPTLMAIPGLMAVIAIGLMLTGHHVWTVSLLLGLWGMLATAAPTGWWTWIARTLPDNAEAGGGLMVAVIQLAIALGSTAGGIVFDRLGWQSTFAMSSVLLLCAGVLTFVTARQKAGAL